jgi:hypothetical protein
VTCRDRTKTVSECSRSLPADKLSLLHRFTFAFNRQSAKRLVGSLFWRSDKADPKFVLLKDERTIGGRQLCGSHACLQSCKRNRCAGPEVDMHEEHVPLRVKSAWFAVFTRRISEPSMVSPLRCIHCAAYTGQPASALLPIREEWNHRRTGSLDHFFGYRISDRNIAVRVELIYDNSFPISKSILCQSRWRPERPNP